MRYLSTLAIAAVMLATMSAMQPVAAQETTHPSTAAEALQAWKQEATQKNKSTASPLWEIHLNVSKALASPMGKKGIGIFENEKPSKFKKIVGLCEAIGLDPRSDIGEIILFGDGFEETDATVVVNLGTNSGNLEGWVLAAPGYQSEDLDANTQLHSVPVKKVNSRAWFAMPKHSITGNYVLIGSLDRERTVEIARRVLTGKSAPVPNPLQGNAVFSFKLHDFSAIPIKVKENDPGAAVLKIIEQVGLTIASNDENFSLSLDIFAKNAAKANQISQLLNGLKAFGQLAPPHKVPAEAIQVLNDVKIEQTEGESSVHANAVISYELIETLVAACCEKK